MGQYGEFEKSVRHLEDLLQAVMEVWSDSTARSYVVMNDNIRYFAKEIQSAHDDSLGCWKAVAENYNEHEFEARLYQMSMRIESV